MKCFACEATNRPGQKRCDRCNAPLPPSCTQCGVAVDEGVDVCASCLPDATDAPGPTQLFPPASEEATVVAIAPYPLRPDFVGRTEGMKKLQAAFDRREQGLAFVAVVGPPGCGKTRLVKQFAFQLRTSHPAVQFWRGEAGGRVALPYAAFVHLLTGRFRISVQESADVARDKITAGVADVLPAMQVAEVSHLLAHMMGVEFPNSPIVEPLAESSQQLETRTFIAVKRFLTADAKRAPIILAIDNLERAGTETINLLRYLAVGLKSSPVVLVAVARTTLFDVHPSFGEGDVPMERIELAPLDDKDANELMRGLLQPASDVPDSIFEHTSKLGGVPRTLVEFVRLLLEANVIVHDQDKGGETLWKIETQALGQLRMPERHEDILAQRLRHMSESERKLLEKAAVCGEVFWLDAIVALERFKTLHADEPDGPSLAEIAAASDGTRVAVADGLAKLVERGWIVKIADSELTGEHEHRFAYPPLWDVVYDAIERNTRDRYHQRIAQWLELRPDGRGEAVQEQIGRHLERAGARELAAARYRRAADGARARFHNERAIRAYAQALACLGERDVCARIHLWHDLGSVYELKGDLEAALGAYERMLRLTWVVSSRTKAAVAFNKMGRVWRRKGDLRVALQYLERGFELFDKSGDARGVAGSLDDIGHVMWLMGRYDEAFDKITQALQKRGKGGDKRSIARSLTNLGNLQKDRGLFDEATNCHRQALEMCREAGDRVGTITTLNSLAVVAYERADPKSAKKGWEDALREAEAIGALPLQALLLNNLGELALVAGKFDEARRRLGDAAQLARDIDDRRILCDASRNLGLLELEGGNRDKAQDFAEQALDIAESSGLRDYAGRALLALGEVYASTLFSDGTNAGQDPAAAYFQKGVDVFRELGNDSELAKGLELFGKYQLERGDAKSGKTLLKEAHSIFSRLGMPPSKELEQLVR